MEFRSCSGRFNARPTPTKNPFGAWNVMPKFAWVRLSAVTDTGGRLPSTPISEALVIEAGLDSLYPTSSAVRRTGLRDGKPRPPPHRNALLGMVNPDGWPKCSAPTH